MPSPIPRPSSTRYGRAVRRLAPVHDVKCPPLPTDHRWHKHTRGWWRDLWASPMAGEYDGSDRHGLLLLASLIDAYWCQPSVALAAEIRLQRQAYGLSPIDRRRLEWEIDKGDAAAAQTRSRRAAPVVVPADDPRRLLGAG